MANIWTSFDRDNVELFPSAYRTYKPKGKFTSEKNFTNIIKSIVDSEANGDNCDGYVVGYNDIDNMLEVIIHGYYFNVKLSLSSNLWLGIKLATSSNRLAPFNSENANTELDSDTSFLGLVFINQSTTPEIIKEEGYSCYLLKVTDQNGNLINKQKFVSDSIYYKKSGKDQRLLTDELDSKQYKLIAGEGIAEITNSQVSANKISLNDDTLRKLNSMSGGKGNSHQPVYVNATGEVQPLSENIGRMNVTQNSVEYTSIILDGSTGLKEGITIYASPNTPSNSTGNNGDIWFKYTE